MSNFTFFHNVFHANCVLKTFKSQISVVVCSFFEFGTVSKWCIREWVKTTVLRKNACENIVTKEENASNQHFLHFYTPVEDGTYYGITRGGRAVGRSPVLCPEHISKTTLPRVMKFHGWIDLIQGECSAQES